MASKAADKTLADFIAGALNPPLIMALVGSLVFFLQEILYGGPAISGTAAMDPLLLRLRGRPDRPHVDAAGRTVVASRRPMGWCWAASSGSGLRQYVDYSENPALAGAAASSISA